MSRNWTEAQKAAIDIRDKTLLVSAAAGSGKTATLTERIIKRLTDTSDPADISKMLIVTFTRASAAELRSRIFAALGEALANDPTNKHLASQLMKLGSAKISTIDSFYFDIVKANLSSLDLPGSVRICDDAEYSMIANRIMEATIDTFYENDKDFPAFIECFAGVRRSNALSEIFLDIHSKLSSIPEGINFIERCAEQTEAEKDLDFFATSYGSILQESTAEMLEHYAPILRYANIVMQSDEMINAKYGDSLTYDLEVCEAMLSAVNDDMLGYGVSQEILRTFSPISLKAMPAKHASEYSVYIKERHGEFVKKMRALAAKAFSKSPETIARAMADTARHTRMLYRLLESFETAVNEEKRRMSILTFSDIRRYTLSLLVAPDGTPTDIARQYADEFTDIYIDEYQDVDRVQDLIFRSISKKNNRFMVGDIKQSIYGFRGAEPQLFADYKMFFPIYSSVEGAASPAVSIFMSDNFRCDKSVIDFTNAVCSPIFSACADSIGYTHDDDLRFSKITDEGYTSPPVNVVILKKPSREERMSADENELLIGRELEAEYIAAEIERLINEEKKADGSRIQPGDIAVLYRSGTISPYITEALKKRGIQSGNTDTTKYFESPDVLLVLSVLNTVDNPEKDIHLAATLRSPLFGFTMDELITIRLNAEPVSSLYGALCAYADSFEDALSVKCKDFITTLESWQYGAASLSVDRFLRILFDDKRFITTGLVSNVKDNGDGGNILLLYEYARNFESGSFKGLYQFLEYVNSMIENGKTFPIAKGEPSADRVSLMTVHGSKGLEFPVCFFCDTTYSIRPKDATDNLVFSYDPSAVAMKISDSTGMARINTPMREAIISQMSAKQAEEEMRILYVGLTRARERLYVTATSSKNADKLIGDAYMKHLDLDRYSALNVCSSYLDWILSSCAIKEHPFCTISFIGPDDIPYSEKVELPELSAPTLPDPELVSRLKNAFEFNYSYERLSRVPSKLSVSRLYPEVLDENDDGLVLFSESKQAPVPDFFLDVKSKVNSAERGTATHLFMQFCDFDNAKKRGATEELKRLNNKKYLPPNASSLIYLDEIDKFLHSELIDRIMSADRVIREQRFNIDLSPLGFTKNDELLGLLDSERLAVQGVIDLILVTKDGEIELYDYKTDRLNANELRDPGLAASRMKRDHGNQLSYYAKAAELLFGRPCSRVAVYSTHSATLYDIDVASMPEINLKELMPDQMI